MGHILYGRMISKLAIVALLALDACDAAAKDSEPSRDGFMVMVHQKFGAAAGNVRRGLSHSNRDFDICDMVKLHFGTSFHSQARGGDCECNGTLTGTTTLKCNFDDVCDDFDMLCADIQVNATLTGILNDRGAPGPDPKMDVSACVNTDDDDLEEMCLELKFSNPDFFLPSECSFSYGGKDCICIIDKSVPCYEFNCTGVLPAPIDKYIVADTCKKISLEESPNPSVFLPALADLPGDGEQSVTKGLDSVFVEQVRSIEDSSDDY